MGDVWNTNREHHLNTPSCIVRMNEGVRGKRNTCAGPSCVTFPYIRSRFYLIADTDSLGANKA